MGEGKCGGEVQGLEARIDWVPIVSLQFGFYGLEQVTLAFWACVPSGEYRRPH